MSWINDNVSPRNLDLALLLLRVGAGVAIITHGLPKLLNFSERLDSFADPIGLGSQVSFILVVFAEFFCAVFLILGYRVRLFAIPLIITMLVIIFAVHWPDPFGKKELPLLYLAIFSALALAGGGNYTIEQLFRK